MSRCQPARAGTVPTSISRHILTEPNRTAFDTLNRISETKRLISLQCSRRRAVHELNSQRAADLQWSDRKQFVTPPSAARFTHRLGASPHSRAKADEAVVKLN